jgi:hypothetical protein
MAFDASLLTGASVLTAAEGAGGKGGVGGFGADVSVPLTNSGGGSVTGLELVNSLTTSTPGNEASKWVILLLSNGTQVPAVQITPAATLFPDGSIVLPSIGFINSPGDGLSRTVLPNAVFLSVGGSQQMGWIGAGLVRMLADASQIVMGTANQGVFGMNGLNAQVSSTLGDTQIGTPSLAQNAVSGFVDVPLITVSAAGTPSGTPTKIPAGMAGIMGVDVTNNKLWIYYGGAPHFATLT